MRGMLIIYLLLGLTGRRHRHRPGHAARVRLPVGLTVRQHHDPHHPGY